MPIKYIFSMIICLALFPVFRPSYNYTIITWLYLLSMHLPVPIVLFLLETKHKARFHPIVTFVLTWIGGMVMGYSFGPLFTSLKK